MLFRMVDSLLSIILRETIAKSDTGNWFCPQTKDLAKQLAVNSTAKHSVEPW